MVRLLLQCCSGAGTSQLPAAVYFWRMQVGSAARGNQCCGARTR